MLSDFISFLYTLIPDSLSQSASVSDTLSNGFHLFGTVQDLINQLNQFYSDYSFIISCVAFVICLAGCFFGYKLSGIFMVTLSFIIGVAIGGGIGYYLIDSGALMVAVPAIIGGIICAAAFRGIYKAGIFLLGFALAFFAAISILNTSVALQFFICTIIGLVAGVLAVRCIRPVIILSTAIFFGANLPGFAIPVMEHMHADSVITFFNEGYASLVFIVLGIFVQFLTTEDPVKAKEKKERQKRESGTLVFGHANINSEGAEEDYSKEEYQPQPDDRQKEYRQSGAPARQESGSDRHRKSSQKKGHTFGQSEKHDKKSLFSSFMDAVDKGDSYVDDPDEEQTAGNMNDTDTVIDNSDRPIENAEYRQIK